MLPLFRFWITTGMIAAEAQAVIAMRLMGMAGLWHVAPTEQTRMFAEKIAAAQKGATQAALAAMRGASPVDVAARAVAPVRRATRANVKRLRSGHPLSPHRGGK